MKRHIEFSIPVREFRPKNLPWKVFIGTFLAMFIMVSLQYAGIHLPRLHFTFNAANILSPLSPKSNVFDELKPKLDQKPNNYELHKPTGFVSQSYAAGTADYDSAKAYVVTDFDSGNVILDKNMDQAVPVASLTKMMTAITALDLISPQEQFEVTGDAATMIPTRIGVKPGEKLTLEELLNAMLLTSANDAAQVVKDGVDAKYGSNVFINAMNEKAQAIGLTHTHFANPQGFDDPNNYSSAQDLAILAHYAITNYPLFAQIVQKDGVTLPATTTHPRFDLNNWNGLMDVYPNVYGVKIGNTAAAGMATVVVSNRADKKLLTVVLGAPSILARDEWAAELLDTGYQQTMQLDPVNVTEDQLRAKYATWQYWN